MTANPIPRAPVGVFVPPTPGGALGARRRPGPTLVLNETTVATPSYRQFLEALGVAVYTTDAAGHITFYNAAAEAFWGRAPALGEMWCGSWKLFWPNGETMPHGACPMAIALKERRSVRGYEGIAERPDGTRVSFIPYPTIVVDAGGEMIGAINVLIDVTDRRQAEDRLHAAIAVKDEFLGLVSHELRTPVTTILGNAQLLAGRTDVPVALEPLLDDLGDEAERLAGIVENLLALTKAGASMEFEHEPQLLDHVVRRSVAMFSRRHPERQVQVAGNVFGRIVDADRAHLDLVLGNLLENAHKYSPTEEMIDVALADEDDSLEVRVLDRGIGFTPAEGGELFSTFYRTDSARRMSSGLGIGLSASRRLVEQLGGRIWGIARIGGGSEFGFALPAAMDVLE